jgi:hypothetical protein
MTEVGGQIYLSSVVCSLSSDKQPVVGLEPDRSDPRMRLKQNWSFQARANETPDGGRQRTGEHALFCRLSYVLCRPTRALAMRAIKCLKGIWWMPWR